MLAAIVIVALKQASAKEAVLSRLAPSEYTLVARWHNIPGFAIDIDPTLIPKLEADTFVQRVDVDTGGSGSLAESIPLIGGDKVHALGYTGRGITVAELDTGVDETHPDLAGRIVDEQCFCTNFDGSGCCPNG